MKRWNKKVLTLTLIIMFVAGILAGCGSAQQSGKGTQESEKIKVGFVYVGPVGDHGFTYAHDQGRKYLEEQLDYVETVYNENTNDADTERVVSQLADQGCKVIFATSFGEMDGIIAAAKKYSDVVFMHCSGYKTAENVGTYFGRAYQGRYLSGLIAGKMTKSNKIGYVVAQPIPECIRGVNAFTLGVREANPKAVVKVIWTNSWIDPAAEKQAAESLLEWGADVLTQHQDSPATQQAAEAKGVYAIGYNSDMTNFAPNANLTNVVWNWGPYYVKVLESVKNGTWKSEQYWGSMADGIVQLTPISDKVPAEVKKLVEDRQKQILAGEFDPFVGPIKDQSGKVRVPSGQVMSDADKLSFNWFVEGVEGTIPAATQ